MSFLLLSNGLANKSVENFLHKRVLDFNYKKGVIITTAHPKKENSTWAPITKKQLEKMGLDVLFVDLDKDELIPENTDLIYVIGGDTLKLIEAIKNHKLQNIEEEIAKVVNSKGVYVGSSAGAVLVSTSVLQFDKNFEKKYTINDIKSEKFKGLNFIDAIVLPHYKKEKQYHISEKLKSNKFITLELPDGVAFFIDLKVDNKDKHNLKDLGLFLGEELK